MRDRTTLVFVEVRYRKNRAFGGALESIDARKQHKLRAAAEHYLQRHRIGSPCRFDVVLITGDTGDSKGGPSVDWIPNALQG